MTPTVENDAACEGCFWGDHQRHTEPCNCEACAPVCRCLGHHFPGVSHIVPCCDVPHIDQRVIPPDPTPYNEIAGWSEPRVIAAMDDDDWDDDDGPGTSREVNAPGPDDTVPADAAT